MRLLKILLSALVFSIFSGCAAYSVMNNDRYYDSRSVSSEEKCHTDSEQPNSERPAKDNCEAL